MVGNCSAGQATPQPATMTGVVALIINDRAVCVVIWDYLALLCVVIWDYLALLGVPWGWGLTKLKP